MRDIAKMFFALCSPSLYRVKDLYLKFGIILFSKKCIADFLSSPLILNVFNRVTYRCTFSYIKYNKFGKEEIEFNELAKIWEEENYDVIIEPAGILYTFMAEHWPKAQIINSN